MKQKEEMKQNAVKQNAVGTVFLFGITSLKYGCLGRFCHIKFDRDVRKAYSVLQLGQAETLEKLLRPDLEHACVDDGCEGKVGVTASLRNCPSLFCVSIGWESDEIGRDDVEKLRF